MLGQRIRTLRKERGLSQEKLAFSAQLHATFISGLERGKENVSIDSLEKVAQALGVPISDILNCLTMSEGEGQIKASVIRDIKASPPGTVKIVYDLLNGIKGLQCRTHKQKKARKT